MGCPVLTASFSGSCPWASNFQVTFSLSLLYLFSHFPILLYFFSVFSDTQHPTDLVLLYQLFSLSPCLLNNPARLVTQDLSILEQDRWRYSHIQRNPSERERGPPLFPLRIQTIGVSPPLSTIRERTRVAYWSLTEPHIPPWRFFKNKKCELVEKKRKPFPPLPA